MPEPTGASTSKNVSPTTTKSSTPATAFQRWVLNNEERQQSIQLPGRFETVSKTTTPGKIVRLIPGWNLIDETEWSKARENPQIVILLTSEIPHMNAPEHRRECSGKPYLVEGAIVDKAAPLAKLDENECRALIRELFDEPLMLRLLADEKRQPVVQALREKIDTLSKASRTKIKA